mmetsp:Transcript_6308/g.25549  ORF Transcript_6308/g.25549 Transcript_6308/m.25549 type:complete len:320 (+) Transcript_6308:1316-2275(+)
MVLQIGADARQVALDPDAQALQQRRRAEAAELQQLRRADRASGEDNLAAGIQPGLFDAMRRQHLDAAAAQAAVVVQQAQLAHLGAGPELEVGPGQGRRPQKGLGRVPAPALFLVDFEITDALVGAGIEVAGGRDAGLLCCGGKSVEDGPAQPLLLHPPLALAAAGRVVHLGKARGRCFRLVQPPVVFVLAEGAQHPLPAPGVVSGQRGPVVVVAALATHIDHAVDAGAATQHLAARVAQVAAVEPGLGLGLEAPVGARVADAVEVADRDVDPVVVILAAGLDQQHALVAVGAEPVRQQAAGGAGTHDDVVETFFGHARA